MKFWLDRVIMFYKKSSEISTLVNITEHAQTINHHLIKKLAKFDLRLALLEDSHWV